MENKNHIQQIGNRKNEEIFSKPPRNYFENLSSEIKDRISNKTHENQYFYQKKSALGWTLASVLSIVLLLGYFQFFYETKTNEYTEQYAYEEFLEEELMNTININTDYEILNVGEASNTEIILDRIPAQELENYLMEEEEDFILYN